MIHTIAFRTAKTRELLSQCRSLLAIIEGGYTPRKDRFLKFLSAPLAKALISAFVVGMCYTVFALLIPAKDQVSGIGVIGTIIVSLSFFYGSVLGYIREHRYYYTQEVSPDFYLAFVSKAKEMSDLVMAVDGLEQITNGEATEVLERLVARIEKEISKPTPSDLQIESRQAFQEISLSDKSSQSQTI